MTDEAKKALTIAASQWTGVPTPEQILAALQAAGMKVVMVNGLADLPLLSGPEIKALREAHGFTQAWIADAVETSQQTVDRIERGETLHSRQHKPISDLLQSFSPPLPRDPIDLVEHPTDYVRAVMERRGVSASALALGAKISPSTLNRALNDPNHTCTLSTRTLQKIRRWDEAHEPMTRAIEPGDQQ